MLPQSLENHSNTTNLMHEAQVMNFKVLYIILLWSVSISEQSNFHNFQTPECSSCIKNRQYGLFCTNSKNKMNKKYWAEILTKFFKQKRISNVVVHYFFFVKTGS